MTSCDTLKQTVQCDIMRINAEKAAIEARDQERYNRDNRKRAVKLLKMVRKITGVEVTQSDIIYSENNRPRITICGLFFRVDVQTYDGFPCDRTVYSLQVRGPLGKNETGINESYKWDTVNTAADLKPLLDDPTLSSKRAYDNGF